MWAFQYKHGDRPLEGYTIQRAAGRGGFGEVYYAVSDSGREVALKVVQGYEQIELRGITQCMNLKSPHLVTIFDVKFNEQGRPFVIMEYVSGPNLRQLLDESPAGLGTQKAAFFLREIAKGLQYLHDCGIVHRDLKPGNIFFENGIVKIGDYGLSKSISTSQHSAQTVTVGTVHYMAPEIGVGKYDRSIDIYALGAVLYEMLTGVPPFVGASPSEVLMKHLSAEPDLSGIEEPFRSAIRRAMAKDPAQRFRSVQEMVEAVFGAEHVQMSVSQFSPQELSVVAGKVAAKVVGTGSPGSFSPSTGVAPPTRRGRNLIDSACDDARDDDDDDDDAERVALAGWTEFAEDRLPPGARIILACVCGLAVTVAAGLFWNRAGDPIPAAVIVALSSVSATLAILLIGPWLGQFIKDESTWVQRLAVAGPAALAVNLLALPLYFGDAAFRELARPTILTLSGTLLLTDARLWISPTRRRRLAFGPIFRSGIIAFVLCAIFGGSAVISLGVVAATGIMVQLLAPWRRPGQRLQVVEKYAIGGLGIRTAIEPAPIAPGDRGGRHEAGMRTQANTGPVNPGVDSARAAVGGAGPGGRSFRAQMRISMNGAARTARAATGRIVSALAGVFLFAAAMLAVALAVDVPGMIDAGRPDPRVRVEVQRLLHQLDLLGAAPVQPQSSLPGGRQVIVRREPRQDATGTRAPESLASALDRFAAGMQEQFRNLDHELARSIIRLTREAQSGNLQVSRTTIEMQALSQALRAAQSGVRALEEARSSLAQLDRERALDAGSVPAVEPPTPKAPTAPSPSAAPRPDSRVPGDALRRALQEMPSLPGRHEAVEQSVAAPLRVAGFVGWGACTVAGLTLLMFARRRNGAMHLVRGVAGVALLMLAMVPLNWAIGQRGIWAQTAGMSVQAVSQELAKAFSSAPAVLCGTLVLVSMLMLAWPPRRLAPAHSLGIGAQDASNPAPAPAQTEGVRS